MNDKICQEILYDTNPDVQRLFNNLCGREPETAQHSLGVTGIALHIASNMPNLGNNDLMILKWAVLLHDIGKVVIPNEILLKPSALTASEFDIMKRHSTYGFKVLKFGNLPEDVAKTALHHHERYDGEGYPHKLKGKEIPLLARICSVADATDAMMSDRPYRKSLTVQQAANELKQGSGSQFDPAIIEILLSLNYLTDSKPTSSCKISY